MWRDKMQAIEFEARVKDNTIIIPRNLSNIGRKKIKVILLYDEKKQTEKSSKRKPRFKSSGIKLKTKGYKFSREEANER
jgi:hypothetical protein